MPSSLSDIRWQCVLLVDHEPWTRRLRELFETLFAKTGLPFHVIDLSRCIYPDLVMADTLPESEKVNRVRSFGEFKECLDRFDPATTFVVDEIPRRKEIAFPFIKAIYERGYITAKIDMYGNNYIPSSARTRMRHIPLRLVPDLLRRKIRERKMWRSIHRNHLPFQKISFSSGQMNPTYPINHPDYDDFTFKQHPRLVEGRYIVFSDVYFPHHPDLALFHGFRHLPDATPYYQSLNKFFDYLENCYNGGGYRVIIAAHPKANYQGDEFGGRTIMKYATADLIYHADGVVMHLCNSLSYAMLGDKPLCLIGTRGYFRVGAHKMRLKVLGEEVLKIPVYDIDRVSLEKIRFHKVERAIRQKYIYDFLTSPDTRDFDNPTVMARLLGCNGSDGKS